MGCIPPDPSAEFVRAMETMLEVYHRPHDPEYPIVCMDETNKQRVSETRLPLPPLPGQPERYDYEYERHGTANIFMFSEPLGGWRRGGGRVEGAREQRRAGAVGCAAKRSNHDGSRRTCLRR